MSLLSFAIGGGVLTTLALGWLHRHDLAIAWKVWKLNEEIRRSAPEPVLGAGKSDGESAPSCDSPWRPDMLRRQVDLPEDAAKVLRENLWDLYDGTPISINALPQMQIAELESHRAKVLAFDRQRLLDDGVLGVQLSKRVH